MLVNLRDLKPNPFRDFTIDPIDPETIERLAESIQEDGFWGGVVCRRVNGHFEIAAGHHRDGAALKVGLTVADLFVGDLDDPAMIRVYARENATQRGNSGSAMAGTVASAIRFLAKAVLTGTISRFLENLSEAEIRGNLTSAKGLGQNVILQFLPSIPGLTRYAVDQQLANLKASGDYARIIEGVQAEIKLEEQAAEAALIQAERRRREAEKAAREAEAERKAAEERAREAREEAARQRAEEDRQRAEARAKLAEKRQREAEEEAQRLGLVHDKQASAAERAKRASEKAAIQPITFDFEGVSKNLKNANQIAAFRDVVTGKGVAAYLPVNQQASLAAELIALAQSQNRELSAAFIREQAFDLALKARDTERRLTEHEMRLAREKEVILRFRHYQDQFVRGLWSVNQAGLQMTELLKAHPDAEFPMFSADLRTALGDAKRIVERLLERI